MEVLAKQHSILDKFVLHQVQLSRAKVLHKKESETVKMTPHKTQNVRKLFIGGMPGLTTLEEFKKYFSQFGELEDALLPKKSHDSKMNSGFGFVTFKNASSVTAVLQSKSKHYFRSKLVQ